MKYFKQINVLHGHKWTVYGAYDDSDITKQGDFEAMVYSVDFDDGNYSYGQYCDFFEPDEITIITEDEYRHVLERLQMVDELQAKIDYVLKALL